METNDKNLKLLNLLKWLYDETRMDFAQLALGKKIEEYGIAQAGFIASELVKLNIIESKRNGVESLYKWKSDDAPSIKMCDQVIEAVKEFWRERDRKKDPKKCILETKQPKTATISKKETVKPKKEIKPQKKEISKKPEFKPVVITEKRRPEINESIQSDISIQEAAFETSLKSVGITMHKVKLRLAYHLAVLIREKGDQATLYEVTKLQSKINSNEI
jgi:hypothetical protein